MPDQFCAQLATRADRPLNFKQCPLQLGQAAKLPQGYKQYFLRSVVEVSLRCERLDLWGEYDTVTDSELISIIIPALARASWVCLDLRRNNLTSRGIKALFKYLAENPQITLRELGLAGVGLNDETLHDIAEYLPKVKIHSLNLSDNQISDIGVTVLCSAMPCMDLRTLRLNSNVISDDGALELARAAKRSGLQQIFVSMNNISSFGADRLVESMKHSALNYVDFQGNENVFDYSRLHLGWTLNILNCDRFKISTTLLSAKLIPRLGSKSSFNMLPLELIRQVIAYSFSSTLDIEDIEEILTLREEQQEQADFEEDEKATLSHQNRLSSSSAALPSSAPLFIGFQKLLPMLEG